MGSFLTDSKNLTCNQKFLSFTTSPYLLLFKSYGGKKQILLEVNVKLKHIVMQEGASERFVFKVKSLVR